MEIFSSSCRYSGAFQSFNFFFYIHKGFTLITWDVVITTT